MPHPFTFVLVPGAGGEAWYWHLLAPLLEARGHEALAIGLPAADESAGLAQYAEVVIQAIGERPPESLILVAQSLAGFTAPMVCAKVPVARLVLVNAMIPLPGETPGQWWGNTGHEEAKRQLNLRDGRAADAPFDPLADFFHDVPQAVIDEAYSREEPHQSDHIFKSPCAIDSWPKVPTHVLIGQDDKFLPCEFQRGLAHQRLGLAAEEMPGGHLLALSQPQELSERLTALTT